MSAAGGAAPEPLGVALVGAGRVAESHARAAREVGAVRLRAIAAVDEAPLASVAAAVRGERPVAVPGDRGRLVVSVLLAAGESARTRREVPLDS